MPIAIDLTGQVALITGGTKGVGRGIAARLADAGATIAVCARNPVAGLPNGWHFESVDLRDGQAAYDCVDRVVEALGRIDILVNNAGGTPIADTATSSPRLSERVIALNLMAAMACSQRANHWMQQQPGGGSIVNISSVCGGRPSPTAAAYGAAKAGLNNYTQTTAFEWAPKVRVNAVTCGMVLTELSHIYYGDADGIAAAGAIVPLGRIAQASEIGDVCAYLASSLASYVTGANLAAHGGGERPPFIDFER